MGTSVLYFGTRFPGAVIVAYEADPKVFGYLKRNVERNGVAGAELCNAAVFDRDGEISFAPDGADGGRITPGTAGETVPCADIRGILGRFETVDMLKIDVEGAEGEIVPAAGELLARVKNIFIEFHQRRGGPDRLPEILKVLDEAGFTYEIFNTQGLPAAPFVREHDHPVFSQQLEIFAKKR